MGRIVQGVLVKFVAVEFIRGRNVVKLNVCFWHLYDEIGYFCFIPVTVKLHGYSVKLQSGMFD